AKTDAQRRHSPLLHFRQQRKLESLALFVHARDFRMPFLAIAARVHVVPAGKKDAVHPINVLGNQAIIDTEWNQQRQTAGLLHRLHVREMQGIMVIGVIGIGGDADEGPQLHSRECNRVYSPSNLRMAATTSRSWRSELYCSAV